MPDGRRARIRNPAGWMDKPYVCLSVSCGQPAHEGADFRAALEAAAASKRPIVIDLSDSLQAHNFVAAGMPETIAFAKARRAGTAWIRRNGAAVAAQGGAILRWDTWRQEPAYRPLHAALVDLYGAGGVFAAAVDQDIKTFLHRRPEATPLMAARSWEFIIEEAAGEILLARQYPCARLYPGRELATLTALRTGQVAGAPAGLERSAYYRFTLESMPARPAQSDQHRSRDLVPA